MLQIHTWITAKLAATATERIGGCPVFCLRRLFSARGAASCLAITATLFEKGLLNARRPVSLRFSKLKALIGGVKLLFCFAHLLCPKVWS